MRSHQQALPQHLSKTNEHYTPAKYVDAARSVMGSITLDPASCELANRTVKADQIYTQADDGLLQVWSGNVWCNPPYGKRTMPSGKLVSNKRLWVDRCTQAYLSGEVDQVCLLVTASTGDQWFRPLWGHWVCLPYERIHFCSPDGYEVGNPGSSAIVYMGPRGDTFYRVFRQLGRCVPPEYVPEKQLTMWGDWDHDAEMQQFKDWSRTMEGAR